MLLESTGGSCVASCEAFVPNTALMPRRIRWVQRRHFVLVIIEPPLHAPQCAAIAEGQCSYLMSEDGLTLSVVFLVEDCGLCGVVIELFDAVQYGIVEGPKVSSSGKEVRFGLVKRCAQDWPRLLRQQNAGTVVEYDWIADDAYEEDDEDDDVSRGSLSSSTDDSDDTEEQFCTADTGVSLTCKDCIRRVQERKLQRKAAREDTNALRSQINESATEALTAPPQRKPVQKGIVRSQHFLWWSVWLVAVVAIVIAWNTRT